MIELPVRSGIINAVIFVSVDVLLVWIIRNDVLELYAAYLNRWVSQGGFVSYNTITYGFGESVYIARAFSDHSMENEYADNADVDNNDNKELPSQRSSRPITSDKNVAKYNIIPRLILMFSYIVMNSLLLLIALGIDGATRVRGVEPFEGNVMKNIEYNQSDGVWETGAVNSTCLTNPQVSDYLSVKFRQGQYTCYATILCEDGVRRPDRLSLHDCDKMDGRKEVLPWREYNLIDDSSVVFSPSYMHSDELVHEGFVNDEYDYAIVWGTINLFRIANISNVIEMRNSTVVCAMFRRAMLGKNDQCLGLAYDGSYQWIIPLTVHLVNTSIEEDGVNLGDIVLSDFGTAVGVAWKQNFTKDQSLHLGYLYIKYLQPSVVRGASALADKMRDFSLRFETQNTVLGYRDTQLEEVTQVTQFSLVALSVALGGALLLRLSRIIIQKRAGVPKTYNVGTVQGLAQVTYKDVSGMNKDDFDTQTGKNRLMYGVVDGRGPRAGWNRRLGIIRSEHQSSVARNNGA